MGFLGFIPPPLVAPIAAPLLLEAAVLVVGALAYIGKGLLPGFFDPPSGAPGNWGADNNKLPENPINIPPGQQYLKARGAGNFSATVFLERPGQDDYVRGETIGFADRDYFMSFHYETWISRPNYSFCTGSAHGWTYWFTFTNPTSGETHQFPLLTGYASGCPISLGVDPNIKPPARIVISYDGPNGSEIINFTTPKTKPKIIPKPLIEPLKTPSPEPIPKPKPQPQPKPEPQPEPERKPLPVVIPGHGKPAPQKDPATFPIPEQPKVVPSVFPSPVRTTPTQPDGKPLPVTAAKPTPTPKDAHVVNNQIIPANGPQPSLDGIAKEVGRIESKMASVMKSAPLKDPLEWDEIIAILRLLKDLFDGITDDEPQSAYQISSPCELDDQEQRIVFASTIAASTDKFGAIINRINAVADLLQHSKNLKQPLCPGQRFPVSGQAVTVNFTQID